MIITTRLKLYDLIQTQDKYIPTHPIGQTEKPVKPFAKPKRKTIHIDIESVKNKFLGLSLIAVGILSAKLTGDGTAAIMTFFIGLSAIIAK